MSWIGRKIYKYLKECEEFKKETNGCYQPKNKLDTGNQPRSDEYKKRKAAELLKEYVEKTPKDKVLEDWNACRSDIIFGGKTYAGMDKRKVCEQMREMGILGVQKTDNIPPSPEKHKNLVTPNYEEMKYLEYIYGGIKERVPFENFKNNRKSMKKEVRHEETHVVTSVENEGVVTITIEPKKGFGLCKVGLDITTGEIQKERVLPKYLMNPKPELQDQYDTLAKLITTRDYYNGGTECLKSVHAVVITGSVSLLDVVRCANNYILRFEKAETAVKFLENFRIEIEKVKHLIVK